METEIRIKDYALFFDLLNYPVKKISFGSESCHYLLPSHENLELMINEAMKKHVTFKLVTPKATISSFGKILSLIQLLDHYKNTEVTINDFGILNQITLSNTPIFIGHMLCWSMANCPWNDNIIRDESEEIKNLTEKLNMDNAYKIKLIQKYKVVGIEADYQKELLKSYENIENQGIQVLLHINRSSLSFSRVCPTARYYKQEVPFCEDKCRKNGTFNFSLTKCWEGNENGQHYLEADDEIKKLCCFEIDGNWIYRKISGGIWSDSILDISSLNQYKNFIKKGEINDECL